MNELIGIFFFIILISALGLVMIYTYHRLSTPDDSLVEQINTLLPQTQCGQCRYPGCRPYAEAIANGEAPINQCPPGGQAGVDALAELLNVEPLPIDESLAPVKDTPELAFIIEADCIGCTLCIDACPVDAILGASKQMHTVIESECTGCELCLPACPVDCIVMLPKQRESVAEIAISDTIPRRQDLVTKPITDNR